MTVITPRTSVKKRATHFVVLSVALLLLVASQSVRADEDVAATSGFINELREIKTVLNDAQAQSDGEGRLQLPFALTSFMKGLWKVGIQLNQPVEGLSVSPWGGGGRSATRKAGAGKRKGLQPRLYRDAIRGFVDINQTSSAGNWMQAVGQQGSAASDSQNAEKLSAINRALLRITAAVSTSIQQAVNDGASITWPATQDNTNSPSVSSKSSESGAAGTGVAKEANLVDAIHKLSADPNAPSAPSTKASGNSQATQGEGDANGYDNLQARGIRVVFPAANAGSNATSADKDSNAEATAAVRALRALEVTYATTPSYLKVSGASAESMESAATVQAKPHHVSGVLVWPGAAEVASEASAAVRQVIPEDVLQFLSSVFVYRVCEVQSNSISTPHRVLHGRRLQTKVPPLLSSLAFWRSADEKELLDDGVRTDLVQMRGDMVNVLEWLEMDVQRSSTDSDDESAWQLKDLCVSSSSIKSGHVSKGAADAMGMKDRLAQKKTGKSAEEEGAQESTEGAASLGNTAAAEVKLAAPRTYPFNVESVATYSFVDTAMSRAIVSGPVEDSSEAAAIEATKTAADESADLVFRLKDAVADVHATFYLPAKYTSPADAAAPSQQLGSVEVRFVKVSPPKQSFFQTHFSTIIFGVSVILFHGISGFFGTVK